MASRMRSIPQGTLTVGAGMVVAGIASYGYLIVSSRALGPREMAPLAVLWTLNFLAGPGLFLSLEQAIARSIAQHHATGEGFRTIVLRLSMVGAILSSVLIGGTLMARGWITSTFFDGHELVFLTFLLIIVAVFAEHAFRGFLAGMGNNTQYALLIGGVAVVRLGGAIVLSLSGSRNIDHFALVFALAPFLTIAAIVPMSSVRLPAGGPDLWSQMVAEVSLLGVASLLAYGLLNGPMLGIKALASPSEQEVVSSFLACAVIARIPLFLFQAIQAVLLPRLSRLLATDRRDEAFGELKRLSVVLGVAGLLSTAGLFLFGNWTVRLLFGDAFVLSSMDFIVLGLGTLAFMEALALAQGLLAQRAFTSTVIAWAIGLIGFVVSASLVTELVVSMEVGFLVGASLAAAFMLVRVQRTWVTRPGPYEVVPAGVR